MQKNWISYKNTAVFLTKSTKTPFIVSQTIKQSLKIENTERKI